MEPDRHGAGHRGGDRRVVRIACQLAAQYHDGDTVPALRHLAETRPEFTASVYDALRQLGQTVR